MCDVVWCGWEGVSVLGFGLGMVVYDGREWGEDALWMGLGWGGGRWENGTDESERVLR